MLDLAVISYPSLIRLSTMGLSYNPDTDVPNLAGKVILITGGKSPNPTPLQKHLRN